MQDTAIFITELCIQNNTRLYMMNKTTSNFQIDLNINIH